MKKYFLALCFIAVSVIAVGHFVAPDVFSLSNHLDPYAPMLGVAGVFTPSALLKIQAKVTEIWNDNQLQADYVANVGALEAVRSEQTAKLSAIEDPNKDRTVRIVWLKDCDETIEEDPANDCVVGGAEAESDAQEHALDISFRAGFTVDEKKFRTNEFNKEEVIAVQMLKKMKALDEFLTRKLIAKIESFVGENEFTTTSTGTIVGTDTYIPTSMWDGNIMGYFLQAATMNRMTNPYLLSGSNLFQATWQAEMNNVDPEKKSQLSKIRAIRKYHDLFNVDQVNSPERVTYMINRGAIAIANKAYYPTAPVEYKDDTRYSITSKNLPWLKYDVIYKNECVSNTIKHHWSIYVTAGIYKNPVGCTATRTGILRFLCGAAPVS